MINSQVMTLKSLIFFAGLRICFKNFNLNILTVFYFVSLKFKQKLVLFFPLFIFISNNFIFIVCSFNFYNFLNLIFYQKSDNQGIKRRNKAVQNQTF